MEKERKKKWKTKERKKDAEGCRQGTARDELFSRVST
jgi:hypothetical protein